VKSRGIAAWSAKALELINMTQLLMFNIVAFRGAWIDVGQDRI
jgi:hypothetical protein